MNFRTKNDLTYDQYFLINYPIIWAVRLHRIAVVFTIILPVIFCFSFLLHSERFGVIHDVSFGYSSYIYISMLVFWGYSQRIVKYRVLMQYGGIKDDIEIMTSIFFVVVLLYLMSFGLYLIESIYYNSHIDGPTFRLPGNPAVETLFVLLLTYYALAIGFQYSLFGFLSTVIALGVHVGYVTLAIVGVGLTVTDGLGLIFVIPFLFLILIAYRNKRDLIQSIIIQMIAFSVSSAFMTFYLYLHGLKTDKSTLYTYYLVTLLFQNIYVNSYISKFLVRHYKMPEI